MFVCPVKAFTSLFMMLLLPQKALEAILLLHDARNYNDLAAEEDIPEHRLLDHLRGTVSSNSFLGNSDRDTGHVAALGGEYAILILRGSLFNHSEQANVHLYWNQEQHLYTFSSSRTIRAGEELVINYVGGPGLSSAAERREILEGFGIF